MQKNVVILGVTQSTRIILDEEFPQLKKIEIEPYNIRYSRIIPLAFKLMFDSVRIFKVIKKEQAQLQEIVKENKVEVVISDNRFGLYHQAIESVYITHQLNIQAGILSGLANYIHHRFIKKFNHVWVPDAEKMNDSLAGNLSRHANFKNCNYLGALSRLDASVNKTTTYDQLILLSGVEPQRSILEEKLVAQLKKSTARICLVRGTDSEFLVILPETVTVINLPNALQLAQCIQNSTTVICRSGYSTLMDMYTFHKKELILIPTPGQTEQLYLANYWKEKHHVQVVLQHELNHRKVL